MIHCWCMHLSETCMSNIKNINTKLTHSYVLFIALLHGMEKIQNCYSNEKEVVFRSLVFLICVDSSLHEIWYNNIQVMKQISQQWYPCID